MIVRASLHALVAMVLVFCTPAGAQEFRGQQLVTPTLIADTTAIAAGQPFTVGVLLKIAQGWHTYWQFSGDSGKAPQIEWELPAGFKAGAIQWPIPAAHLEEGDLLTYVYEGEVLLPVEITPPAELPKGDVVLKAKLKWLVCEKTCVPGNGAVALTLPASGTSAPANNEVFAAWRARLPKTTGAPFSVKWENKADALALHVVGVPPDAKLEFFPLPPTGGASPGHPKVSEPGSEPARTITVPVENGSPDGAWRGVLVVQASDGARQGWLVSPDTSARAPSAAAVAARGGLLAALWSAFLGGLILNLMPCVLPVIALKIFGFVRQAGEDPRRVFHLGLAFVGGVFVFFLVLAGLAIVVRSAGSNFFWGMQFSDARLLLGLIALVVLFALSMFGVFEITLGGAAENAIGSLSRREGYSGAFVHGLFTTLLGTSCTAPFVGPVLGFAVTQPPVSIVAIFTAMAAGMSLPYFLLTWKPAWMRFVPKPGMWMERFKQMMGFVLLAVAVWLLGVLGKTRGAEAMTAAAWFLVVLSLAAWIWGAGRRRWWAILLAVVVAAAGTKSFLPDALKKIEQRGKAIQPNQVGIVWEPFSEKRLEQARNGGVPVFIDFTAEWCPNCKANEKFVLNTTSVAAAFKAKRVVTLVADWTDFDPTITKWLKSFERIGVPVYVLYYGDGSEPVVLSEFLTQRSLLEQLARIQS